MTLIVTLVAPFGILGLGTASAVGTNLILNPAMELLNPSDPTSPENWNQDFWGTNTPVFTYPVAGQDGGRAAQVQITKYTDGDAKWSFNHVNVTPGATYAFSDSYKSDVPTELVIEYQTNANAFDYVSLGELPVANNWISTTKSFTAPVGVKSATVYHILKSVGTLTTDSASLTTDSSIPPVVVPPVIVPPSPVPPLPVPTPTAGNLISNPSVETVSNTSAAIPLDWDNDFWGTNTAAFSYPIAGQDGAKGLGVKMTAYTSGDAKWYFKHVPVTPGKTYTFSDNYQSNVATTVTLEYKSLAGALSYEDLDTALPASASWTKYTKSFIPPSGVTAVTVLHHISEIGFLNTDNFVLESE